MQSIRLAYQIITETVNRFFTGHCALRAAALAFTTLLSLVPLLTVSFTVLVAFPKFKHVEPLITGFIFEHFVASSAQTIQGYLYQFTNHASQLTPIGSLSLLATAVLLIFNIEKAFNAIWHVKKSRNIISAFLLYWAVLTLAPLLIGFSVLISAHLSAWHIFTGDIFGIRKIISKLTPYLFSFITFTLLYIAVPNCKVPRNAAIAAGLFSAFLFQWVKYGFTLYFKYFQTYQLLYGTLAAIPIFLIWLYLLWLIILLGAVISQTLTHPYQIEQTNNASTHSRKRAKMHR